MAFDTPEAVRQVLSSGVFAHIDFDMPRTLRHTVLRRADQALAEAPLAGDFHRADDIFGTVSAGLVEDIRTAILATSDWDPTLLRPEVMRWFDDILATMHGEVLVRRNRAWRAAFAASTLPTGDAPHPPPTPRPPADCPG
jgi:hypothetical protein